MNRQERLFLKHKCQLRCEFCNRWTPVPYDTWRGIAVDDRGNPVTDYLWFCRRRTCIRSRPVTVWDPDNYVAQFKKGRSKAGSQTNSRQPARNKAKRKNKQARPEFTKTASAETEDA